MKQKKMVSVAEFAKLAEMPKVKVYSILEKAEYRNYISVDSGLKMVDVALLDVLHGNIPEVADKKEASAESQPKTAQKPQQSTDEARDKETITELCAKIEAYKAFIEEKDKEIVELKATIEARDKTIQEMSLKMADMAVSTQTITEKALNAVNQQQILTAIATKKMPWYRRLLGIGKKNEEENGM